MTRDITLEDLRRVVGALVDLSQYDWLYADLYLDRAAQLLPKLCTQTRYRQSLEATGRLANLTDRLRRAAERGDLTAVEELAEEGLHARKDRFDDSELFSMAARVYGPRCIDVDPAALALTGVVAQSRQHTTHARDRVLEELWVLESNDAELRRFYRDRSRYFEQIAIVNDDSARTTVDTSTRRDELFDAIRRGDFARVQRLASPPGDRSQSKRGRVRPPRPATPTIENLALPFPKRARQACNLFGLAPEVLDAFAGANSYLSCTCADHATFPPSPLSETNKKAVGCTCGHACPPDIQGALQDNLELLMVHPFVTSVGTRYLPWFGREAVLVETFPENVSDSPSELLSALGLSARRGLPRMKIEDALRRNGPKVSELLELDPVEFTLACIPFDVYARLAPRYSWGLRELWTHFDGYQLTSGSRLSALVGGDVRFGGPYDLCTVARDYDPERLIARFAVLRRQRFLVRETQRAVGEEAAM